MLFYPWSTMPQNEATPLACLQSLWLYGKTPFRAELAAQYDPVSKILNTWLHERQAINSLHDSIEANPNVSHAGLVDRLLAMNDLRALRLKWKNLSPIDGLSTEDLLCMAFKVMTNTEGSEELFKDGLAGLELGAFSFLRSEDSKIVVHALSTCFG
jgi:hypothetical protein